LRCEEFLLGRGQYLPNRDAVRQENGVEDLPAFVGYLIAMGMGEFAE
jgi:hypothetical protein